MKYPTSKGELLQTVQVEYLLLLSLVDGFSEEEQGMPGANGEWAIKDILTHLAAWEQLFLGWYQAGLRGEKPVTPAPGFTWGWKSLAALNQQIFERDRQVSPAAARQIFADSHAQVVSLLETLSEEELFTPGRYSWLGKATLEASIRANTYNHYRWASKLIGHFKN